MSTGVGDDVGMEDEDGRGGRERGRDEVGLRFGLLANRIGDARHGPVMPNFFVVINTREPLPSIQWATSNFSLRFNTFELF